MVFHIVRSVNTWKKSFPAAEPGSEFEEIIQKSDTDAEFRQFAIKTTSGVSQLVSALTIFSIAYIFKWGGGLERVICILFGLVELTNIGLSEHIIVLGLSRSGQLKPLWLQFYSRIRSFVAIGSVITLALINFD